MHLLDFRPAIETPANEGVRAWVECLILNPCDGFHVAEARFCTIDGEFLGFFQFAASEPWPAGSIVAWAKLPDSFKLAEGFAR